MTTVAPRDQNLPPAFAGWFQARGWSPHAHQLEMLAAAREGQSALLIAPTGGGKTLAGFLPSLMDLSDAPRFSLYSLAVAEAEAGAGVLMGHGFLLEPQLSAGTLVPLSSRRHPTGRALVLDRPARARRRRHGMNT